MIKLVSCVLLGLLLLTSAVSAQDTSTPTPSYINYTVAQGDTLSSIAVRFGTTARAILAANNLVNPNVIYVGTVLRIPTGAAPAQPSATPRPQQTAVLTPTAIPSPTPAPTQRLIPFDLGGEVFSFDHAELMQSAGMTWAKIEIYWMLGDSTDNAKRFIDQAHLAGFKVLLQISGDPAEFGANPAEYNPQFATYLGAVAALSPDAIEVWGAMNDASAWPSGRISPAAYTQMLSGAFPAIKRANPQVLVISGALAQSDTTPCSSTGCNDLDYLNGMAQAGVGQFADCIGMAYTLGAVAPSIDSGDSRGDDFFYYYSTTLSTYTHIFPTKPLCFTEIGYFVPGETATRGYKWAQNTTPLNQAAWLAQALTLAFQNGHVLLFMVYNVDATDSPQSNYAIVDANNHCLACNSLSNALTSQ